MVIKQIFPTGIYVKILFHIIKAYLIVIEFPTIYIPAGQCGIIYIKITLWLCRFALRPSICRYRITDYTMFL